ncbi:hypothetical protein KIL84_018860, partial [Mauremys mutica]
SEQRAAAASTFQLIFSLSFPSQSLIHVLARENRSPSNLPLFTFIFNLVLEQGPQNKPPPPLPLNPNATARSGLLLIPHLRDTLCVSLSHSSPFSATAVLGSPPILPRPPFCPCGNFFLPPFVYVTMAVPAALIPPTQLVPPPPPISTSAACTTTTTTSSATSSPSPSIAPPPASSGTNLFRPEPIAAAAAAAAATVTSTTSSGGGGSSSSSSNGGGGGGNNCSPSLGTSSSSSSAGGGGTSTPSASTANSSSLPGKPVYSTPSPVENTPQNNECKMVDLRGAKVASFTVEGCELICLPQAFDLFLKHLVGGLHTVYTKLKRLEITPVVCNVEQVRILRGLGAIQPGVNRCKLISRKDFETLYNDCTNARYSWEIS